MKFLGQYTVRGKLSEADTTGGNPARIRLFDGRFDTGYKVTDFVVWGSTLTSSSTPDVSGKLGTTDNLITSHVNFMNADDVREIAWASSAGSTDTAFNAPTGKIIDPDNFVVEDLFVYVRTPAGSDEDVNYMVTMEKYDTTDSKGVLAMIKNHAQDINQ